MKWSRSAAACLALLVCACLFAELPQWIQNLDIGSGLESVFFVQAGPVLVRRPPRETGPQLTKLITAKPSAADLYSLRAYEAEQQLDFGAAEADWKKYSGLAANKVAGQIALADYYHRRLRPEDEIQALAGVAQGHLPFADARVADGFQRTFDLIAAHSLPADFAAAQYGIWMNAYPAEAGIYKQYFEYALSQGRYADAEQAIQRYSKQFPQDGVFPLSARAQIAERRGSVEEALTIYDQALKPLSPQDLVLRYFELLKKTRNLRVFLERARSASASSPDDLNAASRMFYYYQQQGDPASAQRVLVEYRMRRDARKSAWTGEEHLALAALLQGAGNYDEAARSYYGAWTLAGAQAAEKEQGLAGIVQVLLTAPDQPIQFGRGDLSFYKDIASMDPYPGFLNGILSLVLNTTSPREKYDVQENNSIAYFHRAKASELMTLFDAQYPNSNRRDELHAQLIETYAIYGDSDGVIRRGRQFLAAFPKSTFRVNVALRTAEAYARKNQEAQEFAVYDGLLKELAAQAGGIPLGEAAAPSETVRRPGAQKPPAARSAGYARVLDRYIARLVSTKRVNDALALYRRELDRNPNDPGLYERLAAFLDQNKLGAQIEQVYQRAIAQFQDRAWHQKLARWYLRQKESAKFGQLTQQVVKTFDGTELGRYFQEVVSSAPIDAQLYLKVNQYAAQRFPWNVSFAKNLLNAYSRKETYDPAASEQLLRRYWFYDSDLRARYFELLSRTRRLDSELAALRNVAGSAAQQFVAEGEAWRSHFESAAPAFRAVAADFPADRMIVGRAASLHRSLAVFEPAYTETSASLEQNLHQAVPRDSGALTRVGEVYADREQFDRARPFWNQIAEIEPGKSSGYLEAATVFWDYYLYDDALRLLNHGRAKFRNPTLFAYQEGAIYENRREYTQAVDAYLRGAGERSCESRLIRLGKRAATRDIVERATSQPAPGSEMLRAAILESQSRWDDLSRYLLDLVARTSSPELLSRVDEVAARQGLDDVAEKSALRQIALMRDPVEKLRLGLQMVRFYESKGDVANANRTMDAIVVANPAILGVVRAAVDFNWRNKRYARALEILESSAAIANPTLKKQFVFEAARKATVAAQYARARKLLDSLLLEEPYGAEYLSAMAETWALEGNERELMNFYNAKLSGIRSSSLPPDEKTARIAGLRRGYIPVLTRVKDYAGAVDQYIELVNRYADDEALLSEAAQYTVAHNLKDRLLSAYTKTAAASPKDFRWQMVLARLYTQFEDFDNAVASYSKSISVRPDRVELYSSRAALQERLMRFDDAAATCSKLYELTYRNPAWMAKVAEIRARQRRTGETVSALERAYIEGRPPRAANLFSVAAKLESWDMLPEARAFAEKGIGLAGKSLVTDSDNIEGMKVYARTRTRLGEYAAAWNRLAGIDGLERAHPALSEIARLVEQRSAFASFLENQRIGQSAEVFLKVLLPIAEEAKLAELEARWRYEAMMMQPGSPESAMQEARLTALQSKRMRFDELGLQLEAYWNVFPNNEQRSGILSRAAEAYRAGGNTEAEIRVLASVNNSRYLALLASNRPDELVRLSTQATWHDPVNAAMRWGNGDTARRAVEAHGRVISPVWLRSYTGLVGLYYLLRSPDITAAWSGALGPQSIGQQLGRHVDRKQQLAGNTWYYYGARYGEYLARFKDPGSEDYLPAMLEGAPGNAEGYWQLGEYYREGGDTGRAMREYDYALQLDPLRGEAYDRQAELLWRQGRRDEAAKRWKQCFLAFERLQDERRLPPSFWSGVRTALENVGGHGLLPEVKPEAEALLSGYIRRNGAYRVDPLFRGALAAAGDPKAGAAWIAALSRSAPDAPGLLGRVVRAAWIPEASREPLYTALLAAARTKVAEARGEEKQWRQTELRTAQLRWIDWLIDTRQTARARTALDEVPADERPPVAQLRVAAQEKSLDRLLAEYRGGVKQAPRFDILLNAAADLTKSGDTEPAIRVLEFAYTRELDASNFNASNFLGLAELRLKEGKTREAIAILNRMQMVSGEPFENLLPAARLLQRFGKNSEALDFANHRVRAVPWDKEARALLAPAPAPARSSDYRVLLRAIAAAPDDLSLRLPLFRSLVTAGRPQLAISSLAPLLERGGLKWTLANASEREQSDEEPPEDSDGRNWMAQQFLAGSGMTDNDRAQAAAQLAGAYEALGQYTQAALLLGVAQQTSPSPQLEKLHQALRARVAVEAENERRRPVASDNVEQPRTVRPRLTSLPGGAQ